MKKLLLLTGLLGGALHAQSTFIVYDTLMNNVTGSTLYVVDTNAMYMETRLLVENTDAVTHDVLAGRVVISQPAGTLNFFSWGFNCYVPTVDTAGIAETIVPAGLSPEFVGTYYADTIGGIATINYCFWEDGNTSNSSCVTLVYDNARLTGVDELFAARSMALQPNPADAMINVGWTFPEVSMINLYAADGSLVESRSNNGSFACSFDVTTLPPGMYMISCVCADGYAFNSRFVH